ncbi:MAG: SRPBCC family protein [Aquabacterium sp.]
MRNLIARWLTSVLLAAAAAMPARADVVRSAPSGFEITYRLEVPATTAQVYDAFTQLPRWWHNAHTFSGSAANMSLDLQAGGCWCERWGGASVMHGQVLTVLPGTMIRLNAWLGPLQDRAVAGVFTMVTSAQDGVVRMRLTYRVSGSDAAELDKLAPAVDKVLAEQSQRLLKLITTGKPD